MLKFLAKCLWLLWCWLELSAFTLVLYILSWLPRRLTGRYYHALSCMWCRFLIRALNIDLKLHEKNTKVLPEHYILIANHPSAVEDFGIPALFDVYPLAKQGVRNWFFIGRISYAANTVYVKRDDPESRHTALDALIDTVQNGRNIALFPEGGCHGRRIYDHFQTGAFDISLRTGVPVLPVFLHYEAQDTFEWRKPFTLLDMFWHFITSRNNTANYYVYDTIYPDGFNDKTEYANHVHGLYLEWQKRYLD